MSANEERAKQEAKSAIKETSGRRSLNEPCNYSVLCREDKEQLDRIEEKLDLIRIKLNIAEEIGRHE